MRSYLTPLFVALCLLLGIQAHAQASFYSRPISLERTRLHGEDVYSVQSFLLSAGYPEVGELDRIYGPRTWQAVINFQEIEGVQGDPKGTVGPNTWVAMFYSGSIKVPLFSRPLQLQNPRLQGTSVRSLQRRLLELGYREVGAADGIFGPKTQAAVVAFQRRLSSASGVRVRTDGVVDGVTWANLFSDFAPEKR
ncbi:peptidoglycan-binding domain-containing protein [Meiothermus cerbereus]|uniref:peptidoglycan-binding domain-containing protein n=1 Tax=Meiothermus cerbereus TaxID=65552 RepID=UPI003EEC1D39